MKLATRRRAADGSVVRPQISSAADAGATTRRALRIAITILEHEQTSTAGTELSSGHVVSGPGARHGVMRRARNSLAWPVLACALLSVCACADAIGENGICPSMDIRGDLSALKNLKNCRVIEGQLSIVLMEMATPKDYENMSFPLLREVTDYVLMYRTKGLQNLGNLFPNLSVIRGMQLFKDFALVIFDNEHLESLGLRSLMKIERGGVRIQQNDRLCYTDTIDWTRITTDHADNVIRMNYDTRLCGLCPNAQSRVQDHRLSHLQCPSDANDRLLCWDDKHCQKLCSTQCGDHGCLDNGTCCHPSCLGGCSGPTSRDCHACRNFSFGNGSERICLDSCPANGTFQLFHRCVTEQECRDTPPPLTADPRPRRYKISGNRCVYDCDIGYMEVGDPKNATCVKCSPSGCRKDCLGDKIDSVAAAEKYRGCTHVTGNLEISLRASGGNTLALLEESLGEIREITGSLSVIRAYPLVSLMFLKNLKKITALPHSESDMKKNRGQVLHIFNNPNLELLWDWTTHGDIDISGGSLYIHLNPKLCYYTQLLPLKNMTRNPRSNFTDLEVSEDNNGNQASCLPDKLHLQVSQYHPMTVVLQWKRYCPEDIRKLLGYSVYYIATKPNQNVTLYEQRDVCSDIWSVQDISADEVHNESSTLLTTSQHDILQNPCLNTQPSFYVLAHLSPYTRYAAYLKTVTTSQEKKGAQSSIIYFTTLPGRPSEPQSLTVEALTPHSVSIRWAEPLLPNGTIVLYHVAVQASSYNLPQLLAGNPNYCANPSALANMITGRTEESSTNTKKKETTGDVTNGSCSCKEEEKQTTRFNSRSEWEREETITFENDLQNRVYVKTTERQKHSKSRVKRSQNHYMNSMLVKVAESIEPKFGQNYTNTTDAEGYVESLYFELSGDTKSLTVTNMRHFTWYTVNVYACRAKHEKEQPEVYEATWCSKHSAYNSFRTLELVNADIVHNLQAEVIVSNKTTAEVNVTWKPPKNPNGFVVAYTVHYYRVEDSLAGQDVGLQSCITADDYAQNGFGYTLRNVAPGNYSVEVTPITAAGAGNASAVYPPIFIPERKSAAAYDWIWGVVGGCVIMLLVLGGGIWYARRGLLPSAEANKLFASVNPEYVSTMYVPDEWEVPRTAVEFVRELGQGSFGMVYEGLGKGIEKGKPETRCAVKTVNEHATDRERQEFLNEASVMKAFDTFHVVRLLGVVSRGQPTLVIMELMEFGDLKTYLRSHRPDAEASLPRKGGDEPPTLQNILQVCHTLCQP
ncbi:hypothetical protein PYW07_007344 [Mythimna separata]|uniref:receptor protein-tyrosine kinase n=1 Tax=Mythimna separata TaxID=271217 RepID=A0AAD7Z0G6_MYTSE|nr:hypothetical protein PYW07_007344 [Mythimna separata]